MVISLAKTYHMRKLKTLFPIPCLLTLPLSQYVFCSTLYSRIFYEYKIDRKLAVFDSKSSNATRNNLQAVGAICECALPKKTAFIKFEEELPKQIRSVQTSTDSLRDPISGKF